MVKHLAFPLCLQNCSTVKHFAQFLPTTSAVPPSNEKESTTVPHCAQITTTRSSNMSSSRSTTSDAADSESDASTFSSSYSDSSSEQSSQQQSQSTELQGAAPNGHLNH